MVSNRKASNLKELAQKEYFLEMQTVRAHLYFLESLTYFPAQHKNLFLQPNFSLRATVAQVLRKSTRGKKFAPIKREKKHNLELRGWVPAQPKVDRCCLFVGWNNPTVEKLWISSNASFERVTMDQWWRVDTCMNMHYIPVIVTQHKTNLTTQSRNTF